MDDPGLHVWDDRFAWCRRCGQGEADLQDRRDPRCLSGPNVIAISHIIAERKFQPLIDAVTALFMRRPVCDEPPQPPSAA